MTGVEVFVDRRPWTWVTCRRLSEVAPQRDLGLAWTSFGIEMGDDYGVQPNVPDHLREFAATAHAISDGLLRTLNLPATRRATKRATRSTWMGPALLHRSPSG